MIKTKLQLLFGHILNAPLLVWILLGFSMSYLFFFVRPIFFLAPDMQFFRYVPTINPIGADLRANLGYSESVFVAKQSPYIGNNQTIVPFNNYPPLVNILFAPLLIVKFSWAYKIITLVSVFCYMLITFALPLWTGKARRASPLLMLIFITGLFSYGFQFELERGQFNVIAVFLCFLAIWVYHYHNKYCSLAYILFTISVQLKVYPLIFIVMFISNWKDWKNNLKRLLMLGLANFALLFVLGPYVFVDFVNATINQIENPFAWSGNHSIRSFVTVFSNWVADYGWAWVNQYAGSAQVALLILIAICIFLIVIRAYRQERKGINPFLLLACTIGALLIPSVSHDYKLSLLAAPVAFLFSENGFWGRTDGSRPRAIFILPLLVFSVAYSSTLFSSTNKPILLVNNFPVLFTMLLVVTFLSWMSKPSPDGKISEPIETA